MLTIHEPSILDVAFTSVMLELGRLRHDIDFPEWCRHIRAVDHALTRLCDAIDDPRPTDPPHERLAREAYISVLALAQVLHGAYSDDLQTESTLALTRIAVAWLLDALEPYVTGDDREARHVLLDGDPLEAALQRLFSA